MFEAHLAAMFVTGLLSAGHCAGMCGGIVGALSARGGARLPFHLAYSAGRVGSYAIAGAAAGSIGGMSLMLSEILPVQLALYVVANILLVLLGLYLAGVSSLVTRLESAGQTLWRRLLPLTSRLLPVTTVPRAAAVGALWGWVPCGLVYAVLATVLPAGSAHEGAALMVAFGLGTLPTLLTAGLFAHGAGRLLKARALRVASGTLVLGFGVTGLARAFDLGEQIRRGILCLG
ncbi:MAG TPA: sulfite exporter TauE/SafE family protein [Burkholderiales bacterium]|nr:sulfite exporter TauE/SafE family protein [Burkholderiales bacterium]